MIEVSETKRRVVVLMDMPLFPYRIYAYNELVKRGYELKVVSISNNIEKYEIPLLFEHQILSSKKIGPFVKLVGFNVKDYDDYDTIIIAANLRMIDFFQFCTRKYWPRVIGWGHFTGRTSGNKLAEKFRYVFFKRFSALIFYESETRDIYVKHNFNSNKLFVANNTQYVDPDTVHPYEERRYYIYVGRIQERKGLDLAVKAFAKIKNKYIDHYLELVFVGGGDANELKELSHKEGVTGSVRFVGPVHDQVKLGEWLSHAIAYVSPGHVGLGVLHSFACGVPVITCSGRLHSVEVSNCKPENSMLVPYTIDDVAAAMEKLYIDKKYQKVLSENAYKHYWENCTIDKMVNGIDYAIKHVEITLNEERCG